MKTPPPERSGLAKAATVLATLLTISIGLCGANFFAFIKFGFVSDPPAGAPMWPTTALMVSGAVEVAAVAASLLGLIIVAILTLIQRTRARSSNASDESGRS